LALLRDLGCDELQGYFVAPVMPPDQLPALLENRALHDSLAA